MEIYRKALHLFMETYNNFLQNYWYSDLKKKKSLCLRVAEEQSSTSIQLTEETA